MKLLKEATASNETEKIIDSISELFKQYNIYADIWSTGKDSFSVYISWGDWKHDHLAAKQLISRALNDIDYSVETNVTDNDGSDTYSAIHNVTIYPPKANLDELEEDIDTMPSMEHTLYVLHNIIDWERDYSPKDLSDVRDVAAACHIYDPDYSTQDFLEAIEYYDLFDDEGNVISELNEDINAPLYHYSDTEYKVGDIINKTYKLSSEVIDAYKDQLNLDPEHLVHMLDHKDEDYANTYKYCYEVEAPETRKAKIDFSPLMCQDYLQRINKKYLPEEVAKEFAKMYDGYEQKDNILNLLELEASDKEEFIADKNVKVKAICSGIDENITERIDNIDPIKDETDTQKFSIKKGTRYKNVQTGTTYEILGSGDPRQTMGGKALKIKIIDKDGNESIDHVRPSALKGLYKLTEDTHLINSYYIVDSDGEIKGDNLTREEARELTSKLKETAEDYIYVTRNATYEIDGSTDIDFEDIVDVDIYGSEFVVHKDLFKLFNDKLQEGRADIYNQLEDEYFTALSRAEEKGIVTFIVDKDGEQEDEFDSFDAAVEYAKKIGKDKIHVSSFGECYGAYCDGEYEEYDEHVLDLNKDIVESLNESNSEQAVVTVITDTMSINDIQEYLGSYAEVEGRGNYIYIKVKPEKLDFLKSELIDLDLEFEDGELNEKLIQGESDATLKKNIATEIEAEKDPKQAVAIAHSVKEKNEDIGEEAIISDEDFYNIDDDPDIRL